MDWITVVIYLTIMLFGWMNIYAAVYDPVSNNRSFFLHN